jgi:CheY-like chemotaxis protein
MADILIVDDDPAIRRLLHSVLQRDGHNVQEAEDGQAAMEKLHARKYAVVLLDLMMPRMNGWEVLDTLAREDAARLRSVIVLSAGVSRKGLPKEQEELLHAIVRKPFDIQELIVAIRTCIDDQT